MQQDGIELVLLCDESSIAYNAGQDQSAPNIGESVILSLTGKELAQADDRAYWIAMKSQRFEHA